MSAAIFSPSSLFRCRLVRFACAFNVTCIMIMYFLLDEDDEEEVYEVEDEDDEELDTTGKSFKSNTVQN